MTTTAADAQRLVLRMIERQSKTLQRRKRLHCSRLNIRMTDRADRARGATRKLRLMTTSARRVLVFARQSGLRSVGFAPVTQQTWKSLVIGIVVLELREIFGSVLGVEFTPHRLAVIRTSGDPGDGD